MNLPLTAEIERLINERLREGRYRSAEEVVIAGLASLQQQEQLGEFVGGEWDALLQRGEESLQHGGAFESAQVLNDIRRQHKIDGT